MPGNKKGPDLIDALRVIEINERPDKEKAKFVGRRKLLKKIIGKEEGGSVPKPKMRPKSLKADKTEIINEEFSKKVAKQNEKAKKMEKGGEAVPSKFKGFSKLPESVQQKMNPDLAEKFGMGGDVKGKGGKMMCRGQGAARAGKGFSIR